jgi:hypothetical protein
MNECQRADYLILLNGGSVCKFENYTRQAACTDAKTVAINHGQSLTLVEVIGTVEIEARWVDAKDSK